MPKERNRLLVIPYYEEKMFSMSGSILSRYLLEEFAKKIPLLIGVPDKKGKFYTDAREAYKTVEGDVVFKDVKYSNRFDFSGYKRLVRDDWRLIFHFGSGIPQASYYEVRKALLKHFGGAAIESDIICYVWGEFVAETKVDRANVVGAHISPNCHTIFNGPMSQKQHMDEARKLVSLSVMKKLEGSPCIRVGIDFDMVDQYKSKERNKDGHLFLYGGQIGIDSRKRLTMWLRILKKLRVTGKNVRARIHSFVDADHPAAVALREEFGDFLDLRCNSTREEFLHSCGEANFYVLSSTQESFGISFFEMTYAGMVPLLVDRPWMQGIWPKKFPYRAKDETQLYQIVSWAVANGQEECWKEVAWIKDYVKDNFCIRKNYSRMADYVKTFMEK